MQGRCYKVHVCVLPSNLYVEILMPTMMVSRDGTFERRLGQEGGAIMNGISTFIKEIPESFFIPCGTWGSREKMTVYQPERGSSADTESASASILDILLSRVVVCKSLSFPGGSEVKASATNIGDLGSIPGSGRSPGERNGNPLQYSCLENPMDWGAWLAAVHGVTKSRTRLSDFTYLFKSMVFCYSSLNGLKLTSKCRETLKNFCLARKKSKRTRLTDSQVNIRSDTLMRLPKKRLYS